MNLNDLYDDQKEAFLKSAVHFLNSDGTHFKLSGAAGSGKTTILSMMIYFMKFYLGEDRFSVCCPTNRAAVALREKMETITDRGQIVDVRTIHSHLYHYEIREYNDSDGTKRKYLDARRKTMEEIKHSIGDYLILDESSMVHSDMINLLDAVGVKILFVGDQNQLPPVGEKESVLQESDIVLNNIYRTDHQDIMDLCNSIRKFNKFFQNRYQQSNEVNFLRKNDLNVNHFRNNRYDVMICGLHRTRKWLNDLQRKADGLHEYDFPQAGEKIIAKDNGFGGGNSFISNGDIFTVDSFVGDTYFLIDQYGRSGYNVKINNDNFIPQMEDESKTLSNKIRFDFAYCITCHNSQGSTFDHVLFYDEYVGFFLSQQKFRYTGITRAAESVTVVQCF